MSFKRVHVEVNHYSKTKSITVLIEYTGLIDQDPAIGKESMMLLMGDAWHSYAKDMGHNPLETMAMIDAHINSEKGKF